MDTERLTRLGDQFRRHCGHAAAYVVRAPGRVNLLGEHTDYNGLPVLPMAIDRSVWIAAAPREDRAVHLFNAASSFTPRHYELSHDIAPYDDGDWGNYSKAAAQGLIRDGVALRRGADLLIDGDIPSGAGLSSSSALVVANALALLAVNEIEMRYEVLAELLPTAERYVGTLSGGMDQATSLLARPGHALRIDFAPLRVRGVPLPDGYSVVVCHSLVRAEKSGTAKLSYNLRVIECRLACRVLEHTLAGRLPRCLRALGDLTALFPERPLLDFLAPVAALLPEHALSLAEIAAVIGTSAEQLRRDCDIPPALGDRFEVLRRLRHVLSEAERVDRAEAALRVSDAAVFGQLMDASHRSCRDDYDISCPALEDLVRVAKAAGASGARLTGAGFGGCTVNLVADRQVERFLADVDDAFYRDRLEAGAPVNDCRFVFRPAAGAAVQRVWS